MVIPALCKSCGTLVPTTGVCPGCETAEHPAADAFVLEIADTEPPTSPDGETP